MDQLTIERQAPVIAQYDAVVCGGGPAGWVAAVSAARNGCRTALIEKMSYLGGTPTALAWSSMRWATAWIQRCTAPPSSPSDGQKSMS